MILSDEEADARLVSPENLLNKVRIERATQKKNVGDNSVPPLVRGLLASISLNSDESDKAIGSVFGVSQPTVSNAARGLIGDRLDSDLSETVKDTKRSIKEKTEEAHEVALDMLVASLNKAAVDESPQSIQQLTRTAKDMSTITVNLHRSKNEDHSVTNNTVVVLHPPNKRKESVYDTIDV